ncbi:MAG: fasciclin domain-containing protein [Phycisphaerales bacterium]|nr:fasciclin domain-containing protein [Phycisphaerales bacterium]
MRHVIMALTLLFTTVHQAIAREDLLRTAASAGSFDTLVSLVVATGLEDAFDDGHFTIFAPTDEAFGALPEGTLADLRKPENRETLKAILTYHVLPQVVEAPIDPPVNRLREADTLQGAPVTFRRDDRRLFVNDAEVVGRDIRCTNGIIQVIDSVLLPPSADGRSEASEADAPEREALVRINASWNNSVRRDGIRAERVEITVSGGGKAVLTNIDAHEIVTIVNGGGSLTIDGVASVHEVTVNGGATLRALDLQTGSTKINVAGGGSAFVRAHEAMTISTAAGASVRYIAPEDRTSINANRYSSIVRVDTK